jgi:hypothetical protein
MDGPVDLHHARQNRRHIEVAVEVQQVGGCGDLQQHTVRLAFQFAQLREARALAGHAVAAVQQRQQGGQVVLPWALTGIWSR